MNFADYEGIILKIVYKRMRFHDPSTIRDTDEYSDCCLAFARCCKTFKPQMGYKFSTYLTYACHNALNRGLQKFHARTSLNFLPLKDDLVGKREDRTAKTIFDHVMHRVAPQHKKILLDIANGTTCRYDADGHKYCRQTIKRHRDQALDAARRSLADVT